MTTTTGTITLHRSKLYPEVSRPGPAWRWTYSYTVDNAHAVEYGTHLYRASRYTFDFQLLVRP